MSNVVSEWPFFNADRLLLYGTLVVRRNRRRNESNLHPARISEGDITI